MVSSSVRAGIVEHPAFAQRIVDEAARVVPVGLNLGGGRDDDVERCAAPAAAHA